MVRVYQEYYETHQLQDQSSSSIAWIGSLQLFFLFGGSLVGGPLFDRFGAGVSFFSPLPKRVEPSLIRNRPL